MSAHLPDVVAAFQAAQDARDGAAAAALCAPDVVVTDDGNTYVGNDGVASFVRTAAADFTFTRTLLDAVEESPGSWIVTNRVEGNFPGSPVDLRYRFRLTGNLIATLDIAP
ncbi:MAG TPA: nuclear transport factor 2 family protein [Ilumatobacter sp.]|nr:nuclear transport factor 2 family protein [Ilumatobacter sp.]